MSGWVYVIEAIGQHLFKIGHTMTSPENRIKQFQTGCPHKLNLLTAFNCADPAEVEVSFHNLLEVHAMRVQGEWFSLPRDQMLEIMMHFYGGLSQSAGIIQLQTSSLESRKNDAVNLASTVSRMAYKEYQPLVDIETIRQRALKTTEGRDKNRYSTFRVTGTARVGDFGGSYYGEIEAPFDAIAIGGPTHSKYNDHVIALIPKSHKDAEVNAEFFANAKADVLALLNEIARLEDK